MKDTEDRLSLRGAADALGISEVTARRWVKSGKLKAQQPGRKYLIPASAVEELLKDFRPPKERGLLTGERALKMPRESFARAVKDSETEQLHKLLAELVGDDIPRTRKDVKAGVQGITPDAFALALEVRAELIERGEKSPEKRLPTFKRRLEALHLG